MQGNKQTNQSLIHKHSPETDEFGEILVKNRFDRLYIFYLEIILGIVSDQRHCSFSIMGHTHQTVLFSVAPFQHTSFLPEVLFGAFVSEIRQDLSCTRHIF